MRSKAALAALGLTALLGVSACGSDDDSSDDRAAALSTTPATTQAYKDPPVANGTQAALVVPPAPKTSGEDRSAPISVRFTTSYLYGGVKYRLVDANVCVFRGTTTSGPKTCKSSGKTATTPYFSLARLTRYTVIARKVSGTCPPRQFIYDGRWALNTPNVTRATYGLTLGWTQSC